MTAQGVVLADCFCYLHTLDLQIRYRLDCGSLQLCLVESGRGVCPVA